MNIFSRRAVKHKIVIFPSVFLIHLKGFSKQKIICFVICIFLNYFYLEKLVLLRKTFILKNLTDKSKLVDQMFYGIFKSLLNIDK